MYMRGIDCGCKRGGQLAGLGFDPTGLITSLVGRTMTGGGGGGSTGMPGMPDMTAITTSTNVNTQVSPQISPNFIQQQQPNNSSVNASATQSLPSTPITGAIPGIDTARPQYPTYSQGSGVDMRIIGLGAAGALLIALIAMRRKKGNGNVSR